MNSLMTRFRSIIRFLFNALLEQELRAQEIENQLAVILEDRYARHFHQIRGVL